MSKIAVIGIIGKSVFLPVEKFHTGGETVEATSIHFEPGGKGFNQAVAAARCGAQVSFLAAIGKEHRKEFSDFLDSEGINHRLIYKNGSTAFASIVTDSLGSNRVTVYQGVQLSALDVRCFEKEINEADILLLNNEVPEEVNEAAIRIAKQHGVKCILNPAPARPTNKLIIENIDIFTPNEYETLGIEDDNRVIMTMGKQGCYIRSTDEMIPAFSFGDAIDTTGAGDTFNGVLSAMLAEGRGKYFAASVANRVAALSVTQKYAVSSIPKAEKIKEIISEMEKQNAKGT